MKTPNEKIVSQGRERRGQAREAMGQGIGKT